MILFPPAKINLGLHVLGKRSDAFHEIDTCMIPIALTDVLEVLPADKFRFIQTGLSVAGDEKDNLVVRAYHLLDKDFNLPPVYIHLRKNIPMGAGLGGGSADATYMLIALNQLFKLNLPNEKLRIYAGRLGSDCPFFVDNAPQIAQGRGEKLHAIDFDLKGYFLKLIFPGIHISTAEAYGNVVFSKNAKPIENILQDPIKEWKNVLKNDFETSAFKLHPSLIEIKEGLYQEGAVYASMTGSGSTIFGIFEEKPEGCVVIEL